MTDRVGRTGSTGGLYRNPNEAQFQAQVGNALKARSRTGGQQGSQHHGYTSTGAQANGAGGPGQVHTAGSRGVPGDYAASAIPLLAPATQALIGDAQRYDGSDHADTAESTRRWNAVQNAIASELRQILPTGQTSNQDGDGAQPAVLQLTGEEQVKFMTLSALASGSDRLARETGEAFDQLDLEDRNTELHGLIASLKKTIDEVETENGDENFIRRGWDGATGGGAREDLEDYLQGKLDKLNTLDINDDSMTTEQYAQEFQGIMGNFKVEFDKHLEDVADSDDTWDTIGEVGRVVAATAAGIIATVATGGNVAAGFAASMITYEAIDGLKDVGDAIDGKDVYADGHVSLFTGAIDATFGNGMSDEQQKVFWKDESLDAISSLGSGSSAGAGVRVSAALTSRFAAQTGLRALGQRMFITSVAGTTGQLVNSGFAVASDSARLGFDGKFTTDAMKESAITQGKYTLLAIPTSAVAGAIPVFRALPPGKAAPAGTAATGGTTAAADVMKHRILWTGVGAQYANDVASGFVGAQWADGDVTKADAIAAFGSGVPGALQSMSVRPDTQERIAAWRNEGRDTKFFSRSGFPPSGVELPRIAAEVLALRGLLLGMDGGPGGPATKVANDVAVPLSAIRSAASKLAYVKANAKWERAVDRALGGDESAIVMAQKIEKGRGVHGVNRSDDQKALDKALIRDDELTGTPRERAEYIAKTSSPSVNEIRELVKLGKAYQTARQAVPEALRGLLPENLNMRTLTEPEAFLTKIQQDQSIPADVRAILQTFPADDAVLLRNSNVVEGLLTDPEFVVNAMEALGPKLKPSEIEAIRAIYKMQRLLEPDVTDGGYAGKQPGMKWSDLSWETTNHGGTTKLGVFDEEVNRLDQYNQKFLRDTDTAWQDTNKQLAGVVDAWQAYALLYSRKASASSNVKDTDAARADYKTAVGKLPPELQRVMPRSDGMLSSSPDGALVKLQQDETVQQPMRDALKNFKPDTNNPTDPAPGRKFLSDFYLSRERVVEAWQTYVLMYSRSRLSSGADKNFTDARTAYETVVGKLPPELKGVMPASRGMVTLKSPDEVLASLREDQSAPQFLRDTLENFKPNTQLLSDPGAVLKLLADPDFVRNQVKQLKADGKLDDAQFDSINLILDIESSLKQPVSSGGYNQPGKPWNTLTWMPVKDQTTGVELEPGIFKQETAKLGGKVRTFLTSRPTGTDASALKTAGEFLTAWKAFTDVYSQAQHDLAARSYGPGLDHKVAEQKPGSSASPAHPYGFVLKSGAYGIAVNLVVSWALKSTPATHGGVQGALWASYGLEAGLAFYNLIGQIGYMRALSAKTEFEAQYQKAEYTPSDKPADMALFKDDLYKRFKEIEKERQHWNLVADIGSLVSLARNLAMGIAFSVLGLAPVATMYFANAGLSGGWFGAQRLHIFDKTPKLRTFVRWASIVGGPTLQALAVVIQSFVYADQIKKKQGGQGDSAAVWLEGLIDDFIDEDFDVSNLDDDSVPLPDRA